MQEIKEFYSNNGSADDISIDLLIAQGHEQDVVRWHDQAAIDQYQKFKGTLMEKYGWTQDDYSKNYALSKKKSDANFKKALDYIDMSG